MNPRFGRRRITDLLVEIEQTRKNERKEKAEVSRLMSLVWSVGAFTPRIDSGSHAVFANLR